MSGFSHLDPLVQVALVGGAASVMCALIGLFGVIIPKLHANANELSQVRDQVANSHGTNLRDDMDFIRDLVLDIRTDLGWVRREQVDQARRIAGLEGTVTSLEGGTVDRGP